jgi:TPR repeat protein
MLGCKYYNGDDVPKDHAIAADWFRKAAEQGLDFA